MRRSTISIAVLSLLWFAAPAMAQFKDGDPGGAKVGEARSVKWRAGVEVQAVGGPCKGIVGYVPIPVEWPEQTVKVCEQDVSPGARVSYQTVDDIKVMVVQIASIQANQTVKAIVTFEMNRSVQLPPDDKKAFELPDLKSLSPALRRYLTPSPKIETNDPTIRKETKPLAAGKEKAWDKVEALYDWSRQKVQYKQGVGCKGATASLKSGVGSHEDITSLFIAACRANGIPARTVWVPEFCYAEFYLVDAKGEGHWIPCQPAGAKTFGEMPDTKPILAKGDNFRPLANNVKERQRYLREYLTGKPSQNGGKPVVKFVHQAVN